MKIKGSLDKDEMLTAKVNVPFRLSSGGTPVGTAEIVKNLDGSRDIIVSVFEGFEEEVERAMKLRHGEITISNRKIAREINGE